jgi:transposase
LTWTVNDTKRQALEENIFGKRILITDHDDWPIVNVVAGYRSQSEIEFGFRQLKDPHEVSFSPMYHWTDHNIAVHTFTCVLALQLAHLLRLTARRITTDTTTDQQALYDLFNLRQWAPPTT